MRNNYDSPTVDASQWTLKIEGEVDQPLSRCVICHGVEIAVHHAAAQDL